MSALARARMSGVLGGVISDLEQGR
jgi:hypothetical protein